MQPKELNTHYWVLEGKKGQEHRISVQGLGVIVEEGAPKVVVHFWAPIKP